MTDPLGGQTHYAYDTANRMTSITNARGITHVTNEYDTNGRVIRQTHADGGQYSFYYTVSDGRGGVASATGGISAISTSGLGTVGDILYPCVLSG